MSADDAWDSDERERAAARIAEKIATQETRIAALEDYTKMLQEDLAKMKRSLEVLGRALDHHIGVY